MTASNNGFAIASYIGFRILGEPDEEVDLLAWTDESGADMVDDSNTPIIFTP